MRSEQVKSVAVIGLGAMGTPIARRLKQAGFVLTVCDQRTDRLAEFTELGARVTTEPADCADTDVVLILVATHEQVQEVLQGHHGLLPAPELRSPPVIVVMSTIGPDKIRQLDESVRDLGAQLVDAPFSGGLLSATKGTLSIMTAGNREVVAALEPVLSSIGREVFHCGPVGAAQTVKLVNNIVGIVNAFLAAEAFHFGLENGLTLGDITPVMEASSGRNFLSASPELPAASFTSWTQTRPSYESMRAIMTKDLDLAVDVAGRTTGDYPLLSQLASLLKTLGDETFETWRRVAREMPEPNQ